MTCFFVVIDFPEAKELVQEIEEWLEENATSFSSFSVSREFKPRWQYDDRSSFFAVYRFVSLPSVTDAVHFKLRFADELERKPKPVMGPLDAAAFYAPYVPIFVTSEVNRSYFPNIGQP